MQSWSLVLLLMAIMALTITQASVLTLIAPKIIRAHSTHTAHLTLNPGDEKEESSIVTVTISGKNESIVAQQKVTLVPGETQSVTLPIGPLSQSKYNLTLLGTKDGKEYEEKTLLYVDAKNSTLLIQTDKPIYKPGETIKFRVLSVGRTLRPLAGHTVNISVVDPQWNLIKSWNEVPVGSGLYSTNLTLSSEPNLGSWRIRVQSGSEHAEHHVTVDKYVLPKFKVTVGLPTFASMENPTVVAQVNAAYTYGKPVEGQVTLTVKEYYQYSYYRRMRPAPVTRTMTLPLKGATTQINLKQEFNLTNNDAEKEFEFLAEVTESATGIIQNGTSRIKIHRHPYKIQQVNDQSSYKPGFPLNVTLKVTLQDDTPVSDPDPNALRISHGFSWKDEDGHLNRSIPDNGLVTMTFETPTNEMIWINHLQASYKGVSESIYLPRKVTYESKNYMQMYLETPKVTPNGYVTAKVQTNKPFNLVNILLICKQNVTQVSVQKLGSAVKQTEISVHVPECCFPQARLLTWVTFPGNEIVADSVEFPVVVTLDNFLNVTLNKEQAEPGDNITFTLKSDPHSVSRIALRAVDQSVLLLKDDKDITVDTLKDTIHSFHQASGYHRTWGGGHSFEIFDAAGLVTLTTGVLERPSPVTWSPEPLSVMNKIHHSTVAAFAAPAFDDAGESDRDSTRRKSPAAYASAGGKDGGAPRLRKDFPESWIWEELDTAANGIVSLEKVVPDTITSWVVTGFAISPEKGLGVTSHQTTLKTFRPFFVTMSLPYSVVQGEVMALKVLVHNYLGQDVPVNVTVESHDGAFEYLENKEGSTTGMHKKINAPGDSVTSLNFLVRPKSIGQNPLKVTGITQLAGDAITRPLLVKAPGHRFTRNAATLLNLNTTESITITSELKTDFPSERVMGADSVKVSVIGDPLGATAANLDTLLALPTGCGEQNMLNFVVDLVVLDYLKNTGEVSSEIKEKALRFLEQGYQRQLTYRLSDGSFSAFGKSDQFGSTWLTAFVVRSLIQANSWITVDHNLISHALTFLQSKQTDNGQFSEEGRVFNLELQGGSRSGGLALSAYVLLTFIEAEAKLKNIMKDNEASHYNATAIKLTLDKGFHYISNVETNDPYAVSLISYALTLADHKDKSKFQTKLTSLAKRQGDLTYWEQPKVNATPGNDTEEYKLRQIHWYHRVKPATVEMTAYALMTHLLQGEISEGLPIVRWLTSQRNAHGGFLSTQDTVVATTALSKWGILTRSKDTRLSIDIQGTPHTLKVNSDNDMILQEVELPNDTKEITVKATGKGSALAQLTWVYYVEQPKDQAAFSLTSKVRDSENKKRMTLDVCTAFLKHTEPSNMAVMEVTLPSGYVFDSDDINTLRSQSQKVKRTEIEDAGSKLNIYLDELTGQETCLALPANLVHPVANQKPANVIVYDYYDVTRNARDSYDAPTITVCDLCYGDEACKKENCAKTTN